MYEYRKMKIDSMTMCLSWICRTRSTPSLHPGGSFNAVFVHRRYGNIGTCFAIISHTHTHTHISPLVTAYLTALTFACMRRGRDFHKWQCLRVCVCMYVSNDDVNKCACRRETNVDIYHCLQQTERNHGQFAMKSSMPFLRPTFFDTLWNDWTGTQMPTS